MNLKLELRNCGGHTTCSLWNCWQTLFPICVVSWRTWSYDMLNPMCVLSTSSLFCVWACSISASELYPLLLSVRLACKGHDDASALSSWHIIQNFQSVLAAREVDGPWPSRCRSLKFRDIFFDIVSEILKFQIQLFCNSIFIPIMAHGEKCVIQIAIPRNYVW